MFLVKNGFKRGKDLSPLLFNFAVEYTIRRVQANLDGFKLNGTHQPLVYAEDINKLCRSIHTTKTNTTASVVAIKENGQEVNADKTEYTVMSQDENAGRSHTIKIDNSSFERVEQRLRVFENWVLRRIFRSKTNKVTGEWRKLHNEELTDLYSTSNIIQVIKQEE
jgi:hypothetical protein